MTCYAVYLVAVYNSVLEMILASCHLCRYLITRTHLVYVSFSNVLQAYTGTAEVGSTPSDERLSEEVKRVLQIPRTQADAINSPEHKEWKSAIYRETKSHETSSV